MLAAESFLTPDEYLARERAAEFRSEYFDGETFLMAGASRRHNLLVANLLRLLGNRLLERDCNVYPGDLRIKIEKYNKYTYPDVAVTCGDERFEDDQEDVLLNPQMIIEVLSKSTEAYDRGRKFEHYQAITSLREYILVSQNTLRVERFVRQSERIWTYFEYREPEESVRFEAIDCEISLREIYAKLSLI